MKILNTLAITAGLLFGMLGVAEAQTCPAPPFVYGQVLTAAQWNQQFACKQAVLSYIPVNKAGDTMSGKLTTSIVGINAGLNFPLAISAPSSLATGDMWLTAAGLNFRLSGQTIGQLNTPTFTGGSAPSVPSLYSFWNNTSGSTIPYNIWDGTQWVNIGTLNPSTHVFTSSTSGSVTTITGTANQITASASVGAVTLSLPSTLITPGTLQVTGHTTFEGVTSTGATGTGNLVYSIAPTLTLPNATGLPVATGISGLGTGIATFLATPTSANLAAAVTNETGSGALVFGTSPTLVTPTLGAALATSINGNTITTGTGVLTLGAGKTFTSSNTLTLTATDGSTLAIGAGGTLGSNAYTSTAYAPIASPTFTGTVTFPTPFILGAVSVTATGTQLNYLSTATGVTGSGNNVLGTSPTLVTPVLGVATGTSLALGGCTISTNAFCATGHFLLEGVASTGATGTGNMVFATAPTMSALTVTGSFTATGLVGNAALTNSSITIGGASTALGGTVTASTILDSISSTRGTILYRGASGWAALAPGISGTYLQSGGAGADPTYASAGTGNAIFATATGNVVGNFVTMNSTTVGLRDGGSPPSNNTGGGTSFVAMVLRQTGSGTNGTNVDFAIPANTTGNYCVTQQSSLGSGANCGHYDNNSGFVGVHDNGYASSSGSSNVNSVGAGASGAGTLRVAIANVASGTTSLTLDYWPAPR